ncbi:MAG TPA: twin-arginine translocase subunit TatC [Blastocatellia bacterium]|nr:twin-arginine translocase subunit TatC [Blastocatellia bacterium]
MSNETDAQEGLQMSFLDHLDELRQRLVHSAVAIAVAFALCFTFSDRIFNFLAVPVKREMCKAQLIKQVEYGLPNFDSLKEGAIVQYSFAQQTAIEKVPIPLGTTIRCKVVTMDSQKGLVLAEPWSVGKNTIAADTPLNSIVNAKSLVGCGELILLGVASGFTLYMRVALYVGIGLAIPFLLYQIWAFISPGLYKHEKKYAVPVLTMTGFFFLAGASFAYYIAFPAACNYLLGLQTSGGFQTLPDAEQYFDLIILIMIGLGIVFQIPTVAFVLGRIGLITPRMMLKTWRYAIVLIAIISAVLTPTADAINMLIFAAPMVVLYFLSVGIVWVFGKQRRSNEEVTALATTE